jgi:hypothetical protein
MWEIKACRLAYSIGQPFAAMADSGRELKRTWCALKLHND